MLAVLFIDLDGFKAVNDNFGHDMGDYLLIDIAKRFLSCVREPDTVARLGGDEFVILLELQKLDDINSPLERLCALVNEPIVTEGKVLKVSPSIGITIYPLDLSDGDGLIRHADQAMYQAKQKGRNQTQFFNDKTEM
jgi:diguanylate cyclase (GGDEF)-like protein